MSKFTLTLLFVKKPDLYYSGSETWTRNIGEACLYSPVPAIHKMKTLSKQKGVSLRAVIQDRDFNYYDGLRFVYDLKKAKLYTPENASQLLNKLSQ